MSPTTGNRRPVRTTRTTWQQRNEQRDAIESTSATAAAPNRDFEKKSEDEIKAYCRLQGRPECYEPPTKTEASVPENWSRHAKLRDKRLHRIRHCAETGTDPEIQVTATGIDAEWNYLHPNPKVQAAARLFQSGEMLHKIGRCSCCDETRPVYHETKNHMENESVFYTEPNGDVVEHGYENTAPFVLRRFHLEDDDKVIDEPTTNPRKRRAPRQGQKKKKKIDGADDEDEYTSFDKAVDVEYHDETPKICARCAKDRKNCLGDQCGMFSGWKSHEIDLASPNEHVVYRHNNMHFLPQPSYLCGLRPFELAMIAKITCIMAVHPLKQGMLSSKGHIVYVPSKMTIAKACPRMPKDVLYLVIRTRNKKTGIERHICVRRYAVENAVRGILWGHPEGGQDDKGDLGDDAVCYNGPNHRQKPLHGRWFSSASCCPNPYYCDVEYAADVVKALPDDGVPVGAQILEVNEDENDDNEDLGPAPEQVQPDGDPDDDMPTTSGIVHPRAQKDAAEELRKALEKVAGGAHSAEEAQARGEVADIDMYYEDAEIIAELETEGFFTMAYPSIFVNGSCDITTPHCKMRRITDGTHDTESLHTWIQHLYYTGDGRVPAHRYLKFALLHIMLKKSALKQSGYLVSQQLRDADKSAEDLLKDLDAGNASVAHKIIGMSSVQQPHQYRRLLEIGEAKAGHARDVPPDT